MRSTRKLSTAYFIPQPPCLPLSKKEAFQNALSEALGDACNMELVQSIHDRLRDQIEQHMLLVRLNSKSLYSNGYFSISF